MKDDGNMEQTSNRKEIDVEIAKQLFGWEGIGQWDHIDEQGNWLAGDDDWVGNPPNAWRNFDVGSGSTIAWLPKYSKNRGSLVVRRMVEIGWHFSSNCIHPHYSCTFLRKNEGTGEQSYTCNRESFDEAICAAALAALKVYPAPKIVDDYDPAPDGGIVRLENTLKKSKEE